LSRVSRLSRVGRLSRLSRFSLRLLGLGVGLGVGVVKRVIKRLGLSASGLVVKSRYNRNKG